MRTDKIFGRLKYEEYIENILKTENITREKFEDLSRLDLITHSTNRMWYQYNLGVEFKYLSLPATYTRYANTISELTTIIRNKYAYYCNYQEEVSDLRIEVYRVLTGEVEFLGTYYQEYNYWYTFIERIPGEEESIRCMSERELARYFDKNKYQTNKEQEFYKILEKKDILHFINEEIQLY